MADPLSPARLCTTFEVQWPRRAAPESDHMGEIMENREERPAVRVVKAPRHRQKSGVIRVDGEDGKTYFRSPCDRCGDMVKTDFQPLEDRELTCRECRWIATKAKPSTRVKRRGGKATYITECDLCGDVAKTPFLPKKDRRFLCDGCMAAEREERRTAELEEQVPVTEEVPEPPSPPSDETPGIEKAGPEPLRDQPLFDVTCRGCRKVEQLRFKPARGERFLCKDCYLAEKDREAAGKNRPDTRLLFQIECAWCGKHETVSFVPRDLTEPVCSSCHEKRKKRRAQ